MGKAFFFWSGLDYHPETVYSLHFKHKSDMADSLDREATIGYPQLTRYVLIYYMDLSAVKCGSAAPNLQQRAPLVYDKRRTCHISSSV